MTDLDTRPIDRQPYELGDRYRFAWTPASPEQGAPT